MVMLEPSVAQQIAQAAVASQQQRTGHEPESVSVVLTGDTLLITLHGALSPAEKVLARSPAGAARLQEYHRQLFANSADQLCQEIKRITGVAVRDATADGDMIMQLFVLAHAVPADSWRGSHASAPTPGMDVSPC